MYPLVFPKMASFCTNITKKKFWRRTPRPPPHFKYSSFRYYYIHINKNKFQFTYKPLHIKFYTLYHVPLVCKNNTKRILSFTKPTFQKYNLLILCIFGQGKRISIMEKSGKFQGILFLKICGHPDWYWGQGKRSRLFSYIGERRHKYLKKTSLFIQLNTIIIYESIFHGRTKSLDKRNAYVKTSAENKQNTHFHICRCQTIPCPYYLKPT